jgi:uncharacterized protein (DUF1684 family)
MSSRFLSFQLLAPLLVLGLAACTREAPAPEPRAFDRTAWRQEITEWQAERQASLSDPEGWRALVGLDWLEPGETTVGGGADNDVILTTDNAPPHIGTLVVESQTDGEAPEVRFRPAQGVEVTANGEPVHGEVTMVTDLEDDPTVLEVGSLALHVIARTKDKDIRLALRSRDREAPRLANPPQLTFYPVDPAWRLQARFEHYDPPRETRIVNILGMTSWERSPGALVFEKDGHEYRLDTLDEGDELFVIFFDRTNSDTTYGSGRYLYTDKPTEDDRVILDFNRAYHPPCAFTDFATCPLPPPQNRLPIAVTAGEKYDPSYGGRGGGHG